VVYTGPEDIKLLWTRRRQAFEQFERWQETFSRGHHDVPAQAFAVAAGLYELLPEAARRRPVATAGVAELHRRLGALGVAK